MLLAVTVLVLVGCSSSRRPATIPTTVAPAGVATSTTGTAPTATTVPPTTLYQPSAPQPSREAAANHLVAAWRAGDAAAAASGASPAAVTALFGHPYPKSGAQFRQCSQAVAGPSFCDYRVDNGLLDLSVVAVNGGWSVDVATVEG
jgi:hypothetical protein